MQLEKKIFLFIGPPGSGKGTLAQFLVDQFNWLQLSAGNLCRKNITNQTDLGKEIDFAVKSGKLTSDALIIKMMEKELIDHLDSPINLILDGYPRTKIQAESLIAFLQDYPERILTIIRLVISDEEIINRLNKRYVCMNSNCQRAYAQDSVDPISSMKCKICLSSLEKRADDDPQIVIKRLKTYHMFEDQLVSHFQTLGHYVYNYNVVRPVNELVADFAQNFLELKR